MPDNIAHVAKCNLIHVSRNGNLGAKFS